jgi:hypothetical protein
MNSAERGSGYRDKPAVGQEKALSTQPTDYSGVHSFGSLPSACSFPENENGCSRTLKNIYGGWPRSC